MKALPENLVIHYLSIDIPAETLDYFAKEKRDENNFLEPVILNKNTSTDTIKFLADFVSEKLAMMIADNQEKIIKDPEIIDRLEQNGNVHPSLIEKLRSFMDMFAPTEEEAIEELPELEEAAVEEALEELPELEEAPADYEQEMVKMPSDAEMEGHSYEEIEELKLTAYQRIQTMTVAEKIQEALKGSREARAMLIKDSNKLVATSVIKSPKISEDEIVKISASRSVSDEVLRLICNNKEWVRNYQVKFNLVNNPKTPIQISLRFMSFIRKKDLQMLSKSKMIPGVVALAAKNKLLKTN